MSIKPSPKISFRNFSLRPAMPEDIGTLVPIINQAYSYIEKLRGKPRTNHDHLSERASETDFFIVVNSAGSAVGCFYTEPHATSLLFGMLALVPDMRGIGLGRAVVSAIEQYAKYAGYKKLTLDYMSVSPWLKKYYESQGFAETGNIAHWDAIDLIRMSKNV